MFYLRVNPVLHPDILTQVYNNTTYLKHNKQGNQRWQIPRPPLSSACQRSPPFKSKILIFCRDIISLLARVVILLIDTASQEVPMKKIFEINCKSSFSDTPLNCYMLIICSIYIAPIQLVL